MKELQMMIDEINKAVDMSLSITCYGDCWYLSSYRNNSLFAPEGRLGPVQNNSFTKLIQEAYASILTVQKVEKEEENV